MGDELLATTEQKGRFTLAELEPDKRKAILESLTRGVGIVSTARELGVSEHTVMAVRDQELDQNPKFSQAYFQGRLPGKLLSIASRGLDELDRRIETLPAGVLPVAVGIAIDKYLALTGQANSMVVEHRHSVSLGDASGPSGLGAGKVIDV